MKKNSGFTLVEVLMSIVIFGIAAYALVTVFTIITPKGINANDLTIGTHLMNERMEETELKNFANIGSVAPVHYNAPFESYINEVVVQYVTTAEPDVVSATDTNYKRIKVRVWGPNLGTIECVTIVSTYEIKG